MVSHVNRIRAIGSGSHHHPGADKQNPAECSPTPDSARNLLKFCNLTKTRLHIVLREATKVAGVLERNSMSEKNISIQLEKRIPPIKPGTSVEVFFDLFQEYHGMETIVVDSSTHELILELPKTIYRIHKRALDRSQLSIDQRMPIYLKEVTGRRAIKGVITNLSSRGLGAIISSKDEGELLRLLDFDQNIILNHRIPMLRNDGFIPARIVHWERKLNELHLGIACSIPIAMGDEQSLEDFLLDIKYPNVFRAKSEEDYEQVWKLLNLSFKTIDVEPDFKRMESSIATWKKASWSPQPINRVYLLHKKDDKLETVGTISTSRYYHRTWLIHQLGVDGTQGQALSHQLYGRVVDFLRQTDEVKYVFGTFPKESHVFQKYYIDFIQNDPEQHYHYLEEVNILEFNVEKALQDLTLLSTDDQPYNIRALSNADQDFVISTLDNKYPDMVLDAFDLRKFDLLLSDTSALYERVALRRERRILVANNGGRACGFAIIEWGSEDQNIFSLFDNFKIYYDATVTQNLMALKKALLKEVFKTYHNQGIQNVISWTKDETLLELMPSGHIFYEVYLWVAHHTRMRPFLRHLDRIHGRVHALRQAKLFAKNKQSSYPE